MYFSVRRDWRMAAGRTDLSPLDEHALHTCRCFQQVAVGSETGQPTGRQRTQADHVLLHFNPSLFVATCHQKSVLHLLQSATNKVSRGKAQIDRCASSPDGVYPSRACRDESSQRTASNFAGPARRYARSRQMGPSRRCAAHRCLCFVGIRRAAGQQRKAEP